MQLNRESEKFWRFRATNVLKMVQLHVRRRARLAAAFAFMKFKNQTMRAAVTELKLKFI